MYSVFVMIAFILIGGQPKVVLSPPFSTVEACHAEVVKFDELICSEGSINTRVLDARCEQLQGDIL